MRKILITGAAGYIGSCLFFYLKNNFKVSLIDKRKNNNFHVLICDLLDLNKLNNVLEKEKPEFVVHFAAQSLVDETINKEKYYKNNIVATNNLLKSMKKNKINNIIFSSTAALYKYKNRIISEKSEIKPISTYAKTKYECEKLIKKSKKNSVVLRFFNVCSSLKSKKKIMGELHNPETHLIPTLVYKNMKKKLVYIYGDNYDTRDGTCIRDYIHINDICSAVKKSINYLSKRKNRFEVINIGSSTKITNLEIIKNVEKLTKIKTKFKFVKRRQGDVAKLSCSINKAKDKLNWNPTFSKIPRIIKDEISWIKHLDKLNIKRKFKNYL